MQSKGVFYAIKRDPVPVSQGPRFPLRGHRFPLQGPRFPLRGALFNCLILRTGRPPTIEPRNRELKIIYHHHPESQEGKSSDRNSGSIQPYGRYGNAGKTGKTISTITILWPAKAIFEKRAATVEVDTFVSPAERGNLGNTILGPKKGLSGGLSWSHLNNPPGIFNSPSP